MIEIVGILFFYMEGHLTNWFDFKEDFNCQSNYVDKKNKQIHNQSVPH